MNKPKKIGWKTAVGLVWTALAFKWFLFFSSCNHSTVVILLEQNAARALTTSQ